MRVMVTGASGFIGVRVVRRLLERGHEVVCAVRGARMPFEHPRMRRVPADFTRDLDPAAWLARLDGVEVVLNAVGLLRERGAQTFDAVHVRAPGALFAACEQCGVRRVVQLSALGADADAATAYHRSKRDADDFLLARALEACVVQPSLVFGPGGASARLFGLLATLPVIVVPGTGAQRVQPVHVDDVADALVALIEAPAASLPRRIALAGPQPLALRDFLHRLRAAFGAPPAATLAVPLPLVRLGAALGERLPHALLDRDTLAMLERGSVADAAGTHRLLGRAPRGVEQFVPAEWRGAALAEARLAWLLPLLCVSIALVWIVTGIVSLGLYPVDASLALLARTGATGVTAEVLLYGAALLDLALGVATLALQRRRTLYAVQIALVLGYTVLISLFLPEYWLHPYGPVLKNLPLLAALALLRELEVR